MTKKLIVLVVIICVLSLNKQEQVKIPKESIRFRVIANSNTKKDQNLKKKIVKNLSKRLVKTNNLIDIESTRDYIKKDLPLFTDVVDKTLKENNYNRNFHINYGKNYFPEKNYNGILYEEGEYESLVVTLGEGLGENFWCVLFPPLCFVEENNEVEYKSVIKEIIEKYF